MSNRSPPQQVTHPLHALTSISLSCSAGANSDSGCEGAAPNGALDLPRVPFSDWELRPEDIEICRRPDGRQWEIGAGAFGQVQARAFRWLPRAKPRRQPAPTPQLS
jgi:hypothetical protein